MGRQEGNGLVEGGKWVASRRRAKATIQNQTLRSAVPLICDVN